jgi:hypothetical protein
LGKPPNRKKAAGKKVATKRSKSAGKRKTSKRR